MKTNILLLLACVTLLTSACGSSQPAAGARTLQGPAFSDYNDKVSPVTGLKQPVISRNAYITLVAKKPDTATSRITRFVEMTGGINSSASNSSLVLKVKEEMLDSSIRFIKSLGKVEYLNVSSDDLSDQFLDVTMRLENAEKARARYLQLLDKAANVQEILLVEKELERLNGEIERLKAQINDIGIRDKYSTITISLREKVKPGPLGYVFIGLYKGVKWLFVRN